MCARQMRAIVKRDTCAERLEGEPRTIVPKERCEERRRIRQQIGTADTWQDPRDNIDASDERNERKMQSLSPQKEKKTAKKKKNKNAGE